MTNDDAQKILINAIQQLSKFDIWEDESKNNMLNEPTIASKINHKIQVFLDNNNCQNNNDIYSKLNADIELSKQISFNGENLNVQPDIVLHENQGSINNQIFACEIKKFPSIKSGCNNYLLLRDLFKLVKYLYLRKNSESAGYNMSYMILFDCIKDDLINLIKQLPTNFQKNAPNLKKRDNFNKGLCALREYISDEHKRNRLQFILVPKNYKEENTIKVIPFEELVDNDTNLLNFINNASI